MPDIYSPILVAHNRLPALNRTVRRLVKCKQVSKVKPCRVSKKRRSSEELLTAGYTNAYWIIKLKPLWM
jgi:hypothetical protein